MLQGKTARRCCTPAPSFRGASDASEPRTHTDDGGYGFSDVQLHIEVRAFGAPRNDEAQDRFVSHAHRSHFQMAVVG
jgi:hypothetical protein